MNGGPDIDALYQAFADRTAMLALLDAAIKDDEGWLGASIGDRGAKYAERLEFLKGMRLEVKASVDAALKAFAAVAQPQLLDATITLLVADNSLTPKEAWARVTESYKGVGPLPPTTLERWRAMAK